MKVTCEHCGKESEINIGRLIAGVKSPAKAEAARRNAKLGGWPKGRKRGPRTKPGKSTGEATN